MALKTYRTRSTFEAEKDALLGLKHKLEVPIIRCLGSYTHTCEDEHTNTKTYNLLLEFGRLDLDEYWVDDTNTPPVMTEEIIRYWQRIFEIATAINTVHDLRVNNSPRRFIGSDGTPSPSTRK